MGGVWIGVWIQASIEFTSSPPSHFMLERTEHMVFRQRERICGLRRKLPRNDKHMNLSGENTPFAKTLHTFELDPGSKIRAKLASPTAAAERSGQGGVPNLNTMQCHIFTHSDAHPHTGRHTRTQAKYKWTRHAQTPKRTLTHTLTPRKKLAELCQAQKKFPLVR